MTMDQNVLKQLAASPRAGASTFPVMGGDARTGAPVRRFISAAAFAAPQRQQQPVVS